MNVIVIGAGILGSVISYYLSVRGANVTLIEKNEPGDGASQVSFAWINSRDKHPSEYHELNRKSMDMWSSFNNRLGNKIGLKTGGEIRWTITDLGAVKLNKSVRLLQSTGYPVFLIDKSELQSLEPNLISESLTAASYSPNEMTVEPVRVIQECINLAGKSGSFELITGTEVKGFVLDQNSHVKSLITTSGEMECDYIISAVGADTTDLLSDYGVNIPRLHSPGATFFTEPVDNIFTTVSAIHTPRDRKDVLMNIRQLLDGTVQIHMGTDKSPSTSDLKYSDENVLELATHYIPSLYGTKIVEKKQALRPMPIDGQSVIGFSDKLDNLYIIMTHSGVTLAPLIGEIASIEVLEGARVDFLSNFRPGRFI